MHSFHLSWGRRFVPAVICCGACLGPWAWANPTESAFEIGGVVMLDADNKDTFYSKEDDDSSNDIELRRTKLTLRYQPSEHWKGKLQLNYSKEEKGDDGFDFGDAHITYSGISGFNLRAGKMKEPFSLERLSSSSGLPTIERALSTSAFAPGRSYGVLLSQAKKRYTWALGTFQEDDNSHSAEAVTARVTFSPINSGEQALHLGVSVSSRDLKSQSFRFRSDAEVNSADNIVRSARMNADSQQLQGVEFAVYRSGLRFQSEYVHTAVDDINGVERDYRGYYLQSSYLLNGEIYRYKKGEFKKVAPSKQHSLWELVARFSAIDLRDRNQGGEVNVATVGASYYWREHTKLMLNISQADASGDLRGGSDEGTAVTMRAQYQF